VAPSEVFAVFEFDRDPAGQNEVAIVLGEQHSNVLWSMLGSRARWSFQIDDDRVSAATRHKSRLVTQLGEQAFPYLPDSAFRELVVERAPWFEASIEPAHWSIEVRFERRVADQFGSGRVWLAGDAAHTTHPIGVHSMNLGLQEAAELGRCCAFVMRAGATQSDLASYGHDARARWLALESIGDRVRFATSTPSWVRDHATRIVRALPASGHPLRQMARQIGVEVELDSAPPRVDAQTTTQAATS
jgi:2-polyprenyl-6-methoxyphenol hydroxylase-like FAD-dependent oxidoreductase